MGFIQKIFGTHSEHELKRIYPIADAVEALEPQMQSLSDEELRAKTKEFKDRLAGGETLDDILPEAFAVVREAAYRTLGMKPLQSTDHRWYYPASGTYRRDEVLVKERHLYLHVAGISECAGLVKVCRS